MLSQEELDAISEDLKELCEKHDIEMRIRSEIIFVKKDAKDEEVDKEGKRVGKD